MNRYAVRKMFDEPKVVVSKNRYEQLIRKEKLTDELAKAINSLIENSSKTLTGKCKSRWEDVLNLATLLDKAMDDTDGN